MKSFFRIKSSMGCGQIKGHSLSAQNDTPFLINEVTLSQNNVSCMAISEDRSLLAAAAQEGIVLLWSTMSTPIECIGELKGHQNSVTCCVIYDTIVLTGSIDKFIKKWDIQTMDCLHTFTGHENKINNIFLAGYYFFSSSYDKTIKAWILDPEESDDESDAENLEDNVLDVNEENESEITLKETDTSIRTFKGHTKGVYPIRFLPAENNFLLSNKIFERDVLISGSADCDVRIWSFETSECLKILRGHQSPILCIEIDPQNPKLLFTCGDSTIICWDVITGEKLRGLKEHEGTVLCLTTFKSMLFSGSADRTARGWVMEFGECTRVFSGNKSSVTCIDYYEGMIITGSEDGSARIFDSKSGALKRTFKKHTNAISNLTAAPGRLFTTCLDGKLCVWETRGIEDETVFGRKCIQENDSEEDCEAVKEAVRVLDTYFRH